MALLLECLPPGEEGPPALRDADEDVAVEVDGEDAQVQQGDVVRVVQALINTLTTSQPISS